MKNDPRFLLIHKEGSSLGGGGIRKILVDTLTGVHYLYVEVGYSGGLTPLLDEEGKPIVDKSVVSRNQN